MTTNDRYTWSEDGAVNELVLSDAFVHMERLNARDYMLIVENGKAHFHFHIRRVRPYDVQVDGKPYAGEWADQ